MGNKEKIFLGFLGLFVSLMIFIIIICCTVDFSSIKVNSMGDKMMRYLCENQYENFCENLSDDSSLTLEKFKEYQENINQILGNIEKYKYIGTFNNINGENNVAVEYSTNFSKIPNESIRIILIFKYSNNKWYVSKYNLLPEKESNNNDLSIKLNHIKSNLEESKEVSDAKEIVNSVIQAYDDKNFKEIYSMLSSELKEKGKENEFINYLESEHNKYGEISKINFNGYEISKDKSEYKFNYYIDDEKSSKKIYVTFWVKTKDKLCLSGISFSENVW